MVFDKEDNALALHARCDQDALQVVAKGLEVVLAGDVRRHHRHVRHVRREGDSCPASHTRTADEQQGSSRPGQDAVEARQAFQHLVEQGDVELLVLALKRQQLLRDELLEVCSLHVAEARRFALLVPVNCLEPAPGDEHALAGTCAPDRAEVRPEHTIEVAGSLRPGETVPEDTARLVAHDLRDGDP